MSLNVALCFSSFLKKLETVAIAEFVPIILISVKLCTIKTSPANKSSSSCVVPSLPKGQSNQATPATDTSNTKTSTTANTLHDGFCGGFSVLGILFKGPLASVHGCQQTFYFISIEQGRTCFRREWRDSVYILAMTPGGDKGELLAVNTKQNAPPTCWRKREVFAAACRW